MSAIVELVRIFANNVDFLNANTIISALMIIVCPITWNLVARAEFKTKFFTKLCDNNKILAADVFAHILIEMGVFRNYIYTRAVMHATNLESITEHDDLIVAAAWILGVVGFFIVSGAYWQLGIHGVYYGDYFGILMKERVVDFPYNILDNPMYLGSQMLFYSIAIRNKSPTGIVLSLLASFMYKVASWLEEPMTELIYSEENRRSIQEDEKKYE